MNISKNKTHLYVYDSAKNKGFKNFLSRNIRDLSTFRYALYNFIRTNLRARYRRSTIGFLWSLLNPLLTMVILSVVFSTIYNVPFADFGIYIFSGLLPWNLIANSVTGGTMSIVFAEGYLKKVYAPTLMFPLVTVGVEVMNFLFSLVSLFLLALFLGVKITIGLLLLPVALILTTFFILGVVLILSIVNVYYRDTTHIVQIMFVGLFYLTPIVYKPELFSSDKMFLIKLNPFSYFIGLFHTIIYEGKFPEASSWLICGSFAAISLILGILVFSLKEKEVIYRL